jgi:hypothetical protein
MTIGFVILGVFIGVFVIILLLQKLQSKEVTPGPTPLAVTPGPTPLAVTPAPAPLAVTPGPTPFEVTPGPTPLATISAPPFTVRAYRTQAAEAAEAARAAPASQAAPAPCPAGWRSVSFSGNTGCVGIKPCPPDKVNNIETNACDPISCPAGYKISDNGLNDNSCVPCPVNTYKSDNTLGPCTACPADKVTATNASKSSSDCTYYADTGFYSLIDKSWINGGDPRNAYVNGTNYTNSTIDGCSSACQSTPTCGGFTRYKDATAGAVGPCWFFTPDAITNNIVPNNYGAVVYKKN